MAVLSGEKENLARIENDLENAPNTETSAVSPLNIAAAQYDLDEPSEEELATLRRIGSKVNSAAWLVAIFSGAERFAFYALQAPLQNYIQNPAKGFGRPGALGMGQSAATALNTFLKLICYTTPLFAGILADGHWGPYKTLVRSCWIYLCGILLLLFTSIPPALDAGAGLGGLIGSFILIGLGVGGVKSSVAPFAGIHSINHAMWAGYYWLTTVVLFKADQMRGGEKRITVLETGERVIVDHEVTVRRIYSIFHWCTNVGAVSGLASTAMEKYLGFWTSFLLALVALTFGTLVLILGRGRYYQRKPEASFRAKLMRALAYAIKGGFNLDAAQPAAQLEKHGRAVPWDKQFVEDIRQALKACRVWAMYPIIWLCYDQNQTNLISQAGQMITYGIPNDALASLNPICVLIAVPLFESYLYPYMHKFNLPSRATVRMSIGFALTAVSMAIASGVQQVVYNAPPCYNMPLECPASENGNIPNQSSVLLQLPIFVTGAMGEVLWLVAGSEYAYNKAASHMKSTLQAITILTAALNSVLGLAVSPAAHNPNLTILFSAIAGAMGATTVAFGLLFWKSD